MSSRRGLAVGRLRSSYALLLAREHLSRPPDHRSHARDRRLDSPRLRLQAPRELHRLVREGRRKGHREPACFVKKRRKPKRTYVWGHSGGGMVTGRVLRGAEPLPRSVPLST